MSYQIPILGLLHELTVDADLFNLLQPIKLLSLNCSFNMEDRAPTRGYMFGAPEPPRRLLRRTSRACQICRSRKVRCDAVERGQPCTNCRLDEVKCVFVETERSKKCRTRKSVFKHLSPTLAGQHGPLILQTSSSLSCTQGKNLQREGMGVSMGPIANGHVLEGLHAQEFCRSHLILLAAALTEPRRGRAHTDCIGDD